LTRFWDRKPSTSFFPLGLDNVAAVFPRLAPWAAFFRRFAAGSRSWSPFGLRCALSLSAASLSAAYEVDDFQAVAFGQIGFRPLIAGDDGSIQFDGYAIGFHSELVDESGEAERGCEVLSFAVDL
jgi:hypothetical protein